MGILQLINVLHFVFKSLAVLLSNFPTTGTDSSLSADAQTHEDFAMNHIYGAVVGMCDMMNSLYGATVPMI